METKVIVCDLDNTLLNGDKNITGYTLETLKLCRERGMKVVINTARPPRAVTMYTDKFPFDGVVTYNGGHATDGVHTEIRDIRRETGEELITRLFGRYVHRPRVSVEVDDMGYPNYELPGAVYQAEHWEDFPRLPEGRVMKIHVAIESPAMVEQVKGLMTDEIYMTVAAHRSIQIMTREATKWKGLCRLLEHWNAQPEQVIYFGDDNDDVEPIRLAGTGVAMKNAIPAAMEEADYITGTNNEEGVAHYLRRFVL